MKQSRIVIIGLGNIGLELLSKLSRDYALTCVDSNPENEKTAKKLRPDMKFILGDATSRLVLEKADINEAGQVIITITKEKVNGEIARVLKENFKVDRVISIGVSSEGIKTLEELGVEVENIFTSAAVMIRNRFEHKSRTVHAIGLGKNEILEVEVHPGSRLANKALGLLAPLKWRIGLIYRGDSIIIPKEDTILKPKDRVIILGDPNVLKTVSGVLTFSFRQFPLEYGSTAVVFVAGKEEESFFDEIDYLFSVFPLTRAVFAISSKAVANTKRIKHYLGKSHIKNITVKETTGSILDALAETFAGIDKEQGLIVLSLTALLNSNSFFMTSEGKRGFLQKLARICSCPIILCNGSFPYEKALVPCVAGITEQSVLEAAFEISSALNNEITAVTVAPSRYMASNDDIALFEKQKGMISDLSFMYKTSINAETLQGNPVHAVSAAAKTRNLLLVDTASWQQRSFFSFLTPDIVWHIIKNSPVSTLIVPPVEESL